MPASHLENADHSWLADLWPEWLHFPDALDIPGDDEPIENYMVVPLTYARQLDWAFVGKNHGQRDHTRNVLLMYKYPHVYPHSPKNMLHPVGIRVQGFVERCNLKPLGNWTSDKNPSGAVQHVILSGGPHYQSIFSQYRSAVADVVAYIHKFLDVAAPISPVGDDDDSLYIRRRVFTKIDGSNRKKPSALERGDDPMGYCKAVDAQWRVLSKVRTGQYIFDEAEPKDGEKVPCDPLVVSEGDFVDVCLGFDIVTHRRDNQLEVKVHLNIEHVLILVPAVESIELPSEGETPSVQEPGISF
ncbi:hypothetical protein C8R43DRAFT_1124829 [Mycena crocata]|nr:hypothetical protein C8R43DRAFT_1124829 [Mycena crocata]